MNDGNLALLKSIMRNIVSMVLHYQPKNGGYLLDTSPLKKFVGSKIDFT